MSERIRVAENVDKVCLPTEVEIFAELGVLMEGECAEVRKLEDGEGTYFWEFSVQIKGKGFVRYRYIRNGECNGEIVSNVIDKVFFDEYKSLINGYPISRFVQGGWVNEERIDNTFPVESDTPTKFEGTLRECDIEIDEYRRLYFETLEKFDVGYLYSISEEDEARSSEERSKVLLVCAELNKRIKALKQETNITEEEIKNLQAFYKHLAQATGNVNREGRVDHGR